MASKGASVQCLYRGKSVCVCGELNYSTETTEDEHYDNDIMP